LPRQGEVQVVMAGGSGAPPGPEPFLPLINRAERDRAERFIVREARASFVVGRGLLRLLLGARLRLDPVELRFREGPHGKPELAPPFDGHGFYFNVSHCGMAFAFAFCRHPHVGVDIERVRADLPLDLMARRAFAPDTIDSWRRLEPEQRPAAFYRNWTRKEAVLKATGQGLRQPMTGLDVSFEPGAPARIRRMDREGPADAWDLFDVDAAPGLLCAAAVRVPKGVAHPRPLSLTRVLLTWDDMTKL
jgi:4'-phosphopantetheinyl transferase